MKTAIKLLFATVSIALITACGGGDAGPSDYWLGRWDYWTGTGKWDSLTSGQVPVRGYEGKYTTEAECKAAPLSKTPPQGYWSNLHYACWQVRSTRLY